MNNQFLYGVLAAPVDSTSISGYCQLQIDTVKETKNCQNLYWGQALTSCGGNNEGVLVNPNNFGPGPNSFGSSCAQFNCAPVTSQSAINCTKGVTVYQALLNQNRIPMIGTLDPSQMGSLASDPNNLLQGKYAAPTDIAMSGNLTNGGVPISPPIPNGAIVLAYPVSWIGQWTDLDKFVPSTYGGTSIFLNTGTQNYTYQGQNIPQLEVQLSLILSSFCSRASVDCLDGINPGLGYCSFIFAQRTDNGNNYCNSIYGALKTSQYPTNLSAAIGTAMQTYCQSSNPLFQGTVPPECLCVNPNGSPYYAALAKEAQGANINVNNPYTSDSGFSNSFGNVGCWWPPCQLSPEATLIPLAVQEASNCPNVCANVVDIVNNGNLNLSGTTIDQSIACCAPTSPYYGGSCTKPPSPPTPPSSNCNPACSSNQVCINGQCTAQNCSNGSTCPSGQQCSNGSCIAPCTVDSDCPADEVCSNGACVPKPSPSIFSKYWWVFLIGLLFLLLLLGVLIWFLAK